jgi:hypothetical protein
MLIVGSSKVTLMHRLTSIHIYCNCFLIDILKFFEITSFHGRIPLSIRVNQLAIGTNQEEYSLFSRSAWPSAYRKLLLSCTFQPVGAP